MSNLKLSNSVIRHIFNGTGRDENGPIRDDGQLKYDEIRFNHPIGVFSLDTRVEFRYRGEVVATIEFNARIDRGDTITLACLDGNLKYEIRNEQ